MFPFEKEIDQRLQFKSKAEALEELEKFLALKSDLKVGDIVERNEYGLNRYKLPNGNQVAKIIEILNPPIRDQDGEMFDMLMVVALEKEKTVIISCNSAYYKKSAINSKVVKLNNKDK